jgi:hypothetical protein
MKMIGQPRTLETTAHHLLGTINKCARMLTSTQQNQNEHPEFGPHGFSVVACQTVGQTEAKGSNKYMKGFSW